MLLGRLWERGVRLDIENGLFRERIGCWECVVGWVNGRKVMIV